MTDLNTYQIAIIGGGCSGLLVVAHLAQVIESPCRIILIEQKTQQLGKGVAYNTSAPHHLLNVPAARIGGIHNMPDHFYRWLQAQSKQAISPSSYQPRQVYANYLSDIFSKSKTELKNKACDFDICYQEAISIKQSTSKWQIELSNQAIINADTVVLAIGNLFSQSPISQYPEILLNTAYLSDPWDQDRLDAIPNTASVGLIGSGLTMIDTVLSLKNNGHIGKVMAISRRGLLPRVHPSNITEYKFKKQWGTTLSLRHLVSELRHVIKENQAKNIPWQVIFDSLRPYSQAIWQNFSHEDKCRFYRHVDKYWNIHRHRMAPEIATLLNQLLETSQLKIISGTINKVDSHQSDLIIQYSSSPTKEFEEITCQYLINCTGLDEQYHKSSLSLLRCLFDKKIALPTSYGRGFTLSSNYSNIYVLGTSLHAVLGESVAIPEIRKQAAEIAREIQNAMSFQPVAKET